MKEEQEIMNENELKIKPTLTVGILGHVGHGKSTLAAALTQKRTQTHSKEKETGRTLNVGYANCLIYGCNDESCEQRYYSSGDPGVLAPECELHGRRHLLKHLSFLDCPGHHSLMQKMLSSAVMDAAMLVIETIQPQTVEHLIAAECIGIKHFVVVQNKSDMIFTQDTVNEESMRQRRNQTVNEACNTVMAIRKFRKSVLSGLNGETVKIICRYLSQTRDDEQVWNPISLPNVKEIKKLLSGTSAENAPIIPVSSVKKSNLQYVLHSLVCLPERQNNNNDLLMSVVRSFDINKPGADCMDLKGGVVGGTILSGKIKPNDHIQVYPGIDGRPLTTIARSLMSEQTPLTQASAGGLIAIGTSLDPALSTKNTLVGQLIVKEGQNVAVANGIHSISVNLLKGAKVQAGDTVDFHHLAATVSARIISVNKRKWNVELLSPLAMADIKSRVSISGKREKSFYLVGTGIFQDLEQEVPLFDPLAQKHKKKKKLKNSEQPNPIVFDHSILPPFDEMVSKISFIVSKKRNTQLNLPVPIVTRTVTRVMWVNFKKTCAALHRDPEHVMKFLEAEFLLEGCEANANGNLILKGKSIKRFRIERVERVLTSYANLCVRCKKCQSYNTEMSEKKHVRTIACNDCSHSISIKRNEKKKKKKKQQQQQQ